MKEFCCFIVETFIIVCTVVNNALDAFVSPHCPPFCVIDYILASALWNCRRDIFATRPTFDCYGFTLIIFLRIKRWARLNKSSGTQTMKMNILTGGVRKTHTAPVCRIHLLFFCLLLMSFFSTLTFLKETRMLRPFLLHIWTFPVMLKSLLFPAFLKGHSLPLGQVRLLKTIHVHSRL